MAEITKRESKLVEIPLSASQFTSPTSGKTYFIEREVGELSIARYEKIEGMLTELNHSMTSEFLMEAISQADTYLANGDTMMGRVMLYNIKGALKDSTARERMNFWICTVFILSENENEFEWDKETARAKIDDWRTFAKSGFFLQLVTDIFKHSLEAYNIIFPEFSEETKVTNSDFQTKRQTDLAEKYPLNQNSEI